MARNCLIVLTTTTILLLTPLVALSQTKSTSKTEAAIRAVLDAQRDAWNRGDIEGYMDGYDRSPNTSRFYD